MRYSRLRQQMEGSNSNTAPRSRKRRPAIPCLCMVWVHFSNRDQDVMAKWSVMGYGVVLLTHMLYIFIQLNATSTIPGYPTLAMKPGVYIQNVSLPYVALVPLNTITESHLDKLRLRSTERTNFSKTDFCWRAIQTSVLWVRTCLTTLQP